MKEMKNAVRSRFPCLIPGVARLLTPPPVIDGEWLGEEGRERGVFQNMGVC